MARVVSLGRYRNRRLVDGLRNLLELAEAGEIQGVTFVAKFGCKDHRAGVLGVYQSSPEQALTAVLHMERELVGDMSQI